MYPVTPPKDRFTTSMNDSRPKNQLPAMLPQSCPSHSATDWKTSSAHSPKPAESWKTSSLLASTHQPQLQQRRSQLNDHDPSYQLYRHSMPAGWSLGYVQSQGRQSPYQQQQQGNPETYGHMLMPTPHRYPSMNQANNHIGPNPNGSSDCSYYYYNYQQPRPHPAINTASTSPSLQQQQQHHHHHHSIQPISSTNSSSNSSSGGVTSQQVTESNVMKRQITVKSVNEGNRVWIDILATETGISLAAKIHRIATFGTRKVISITTTQGHAVPLTRRPIFGAKSGMELAEVKNGEYWKVEWVALDPSVLNKVFSKLIK